MKIIIELVINEKTYYNLPNILEILGHNIEAGSKPNMVTTWDGKKIGTIHYEKGA